MSVPDSICRDFTEYVGTRTNSRDRTEFVGTQERLPGIEKICQEVRKNVRTWQKLRVYYSQKILQ